MRGDPVSMATDTEVLAQLLLLAGLITATTEYSILIHRRVERRALAERQTAEASGLQGLVRIFLASGDRRAS